MSRIKDYATLFGIAGAIVALDQWTKYLVQTKLALGEYWSPFPWLTPFARIIHSNNTGAAFGLFPAGSSIFTIIAIIVSVGIIIYYPRVPRSQRALRLALALQLAGALGNLVSRLINGTVTDFISIGRFAIFNVADSSISIGTAILIAVMWLEERHPSEEKQDLADSASHLTQEQDTDME
ncbi:MAG: signal peptidase II [Anaerolineales bacterium]